MDETSAQWIPFCHEPFVARLEYGFGPGTACALAVGIEDGVIIVSPPCRVPEAAYEVPGAPGPVRALLAPNAFHTMGVRSWNSRYPKIPVFAPAQSIERVQARSGKNQLEMHRVLLAADRGQNRGRGKIAK